jgi:hypothetical protein
LEPVLERSRADAGISTGSKRLIVDRQAVGVARLTICDHLVWIVCRRQEAFDQFVQTYPFGPGYLDYAICRRVECDLGEGGSDVIGSNWLKQGWRHVNRLSDGAELGDAAREFEELRCRTIV